MSNDIATTNDIAPCAICAVAASRKASDPVPLASSPTTTAQRRLLPPLHLCKKHWNQYDTDWLLLGWCADHYGQALQFCPEHHRIIEPM
jgi:hypothetical protein